MQNYNSKFKSDLHQRCYRFSLEVIKLADILPNKVAAKIILQQLIRSATSIGANLIEARAQAQGSSLRSFTKLLLKAPTKPSIG